MGMYIRDLLCANKRHVVSVGRRASLNEAVSLMVEHDLGSIVVTADGNLHGMLTFREILRTLHDDRASFHCARVSDLMLPGLVSATPEMTINALRQLFVETRVRYIPLLEGGVPIGVVSPRDVANGVFAADRIENILLRT